MDIKAAKEEITRTLQAYTARDDKGDYLIPPIRQRPVLLMGPPGIGKTQIMRQIADETGVGLVAYTITHHTRQSAMGLPFIEKKVYGGREYSVTEYTMSEILASVYDLMEETGVREGILFLDEINCVSETLTPMMLQFLQCKTFGNQSLPEGWLIVAAGNPPEYNRSVREFDIVTLDRVKKIDVEADYPVWREYAYSRALHPAVIQYLDIRREHFFVMERSERGLEFATPRGWEDLSGMLLAYEKLGLKPSRDLIIQYIECPAVAADFTNYLSLYYKYRSSYHVDDILRGTYVNVNALELAAAPFDERVIVMGLIRSRLSNDAREMYEASALTETKDHERIAAISAEFDHAFSYLEQTFGTGQELVIFVTELTADRYTSRFIEEYGCDAYYRFSRELLFDDEDREIRAALASRTAEAQKTAASASNN